MLKNKNNPSVEERFSTHLMTPKEAAGYLGLHLITIYRLMKKRELPGFKIGGQWRFKKDLLDSWILENIKSHRKTALKI